MKTILALALLVSLTGCVTSRTHKLPPISADKLTIIHTDPAGKIEASAAGVKVTEATITAESVRWEISYPLWHDIVLAEGYKQKREKEDIKP